MGTFDDLINQVDAFIRKYYKNLMIKGGILFVIILLATFLLVSGLEYIGRFNSFVRGVLFFSFVLLNAYVLVKYFITPLLKLFSFGKRISRFQAATIIGEFFPNVNDRLLNTLQLKETSETNPKNIDFLIASIEQNAKEMNKIRFTSAVDYSTNKRFLRYFFPILFVVVLIGILFPKLYTDGSERVIRYNQTFIKPPNFTFELENKNLRVEEGEGLTLQVKIIPLPGEAIPNRIYLKTNDGLFLMEKSAKNKASYKLNNLNSDIHFQFKAGNDLSHVFSIEVVKRSSIGHLKAELSFPKYLNRSNESIDNPGDLIVPEGTFITWNGVSKNAKQLSIFSIDSTAFFKKETGFRFRQRAMQSQDLLFVLENKTTSSKDTSAFRIDVIPDNYPSINVQTRNDSLNKNKIYFSGNAQDDYGLTGIVFHYTITRKSGEKFEKTTVVPGIGGQQSPFSMTFDIGNLPLELDDRLSYFFVVFDNDGIRGPKSSKSSVFEYKAPSFEELKQQRNEDKDKAKENLQELMRKAEQFNTQMTNLKQEIANSKNSSWKQLDQLKDLQNQQQQLLDKMNQVKEEMKNSFEEKDKLSPADEKLLEKQKELEELLNSIMDDELKELLEELQKLMEDNKMKDLLEKMEDIEMNSEDMSKQMDRTMEALKRMDVEERVEDLQKSLQELADKQNQLKEDFADGNIDKEDAAEEQDKLNKEFEALKEELNEMLEKNDDLKRPMNFDGLEELGDEISKDMQGAQQDIQEGNQKGASQKQKSAGDKMKEAASQMMAQMQQSQQQQDMEDLQALRALQENLLRLSFKQEDNMLSFSKVDQFDPHFITLGKEQRNIMDNFKPVEDSLNALADRIPKIASFVKQELGEINKQYKYIPGHIGERETRLLTAKQQLVMTSINNLALFIDESIQAAQMQMQGSGDGEGEGEDGDGKGGNKPGSKPGNKPGGQGGEMDGLKEMIKKQMDQLKKGMQPGGNQPGKDGNPMLMPFGAQQAAKMAAEQSAMQQKIQELRDKLNKEGGQKAGNEMNKLLKELEKQREDLINKKWDQQLIKRQQEIMTRLLESEKAMEERGFEEKRESKSGKDVNYGNQIEFLEYKKQKERQIELLRSLDPSFSRYYKEKANDYFLNIN